MRSLVLSSLLALSFLGVAHAKTTTAVAAHDTCETAVALQADDHMAGVAKEYVWLRENYPDFRPAKQSLIQCDGKPTDAFELEDAQGNTVKVLFDLSGYWGKGF